jgi:uncharacterized membrane protein
MIWLLAHGEGGTWLPLEMTPIHPILVNFTAALVPVSFAAEVLGRILKKPSLTGTAWWTLLAAAMVTPLTAAAGWYWKNQMDMDGTGGRQMAIHQWLGITLALLFIVIAAWRGRMFKRNRTPGYGYLSVLAVLVGLLTLQGHLGGVMSFGSGDADAKHDQSPTPHAGMSSPETTPRGVPTKSGDSTMATAPASVDVPGMATDMPMPASAATAPAPPPASPAASSDDAEGWSDSIHVKRKVP